MLISVDVSALVALAATCVIVRDIAIENIGYEVIYKLLKWCVKQGVASAAHTCVAGRGSGAVHGAEELPRRSIMSSGKLVPRRYVASWHCY